MNRHVPLREDAEELAPGDEAVAVLVVRRGVEADRVPQHEEHSLEGALESLEGEGLLVQVVRLPALHEVRRLRLRLLPARIIRMIEL